MIENMADALLARPPWQRMTLLTLGPSLVIALVWQFLVATAVLERVGLVEQLQRDEALILNEQRIAVKLEDLDQRRSTLQQHLKETLASLPSSAEIDDILQSISQNAVKAGLDLKMFQQRDPQRGELYVELPVNVSLVGEFHDIVRFFDNISRLTKIVAIDNIVISSLQRTAVAGAQRSAVQEPLQADFTLTAFRIPESGELLGTLTSPAVSNRR